MMQKTISMLFDYHYSLFERIWDIVADLSAEQFVADSEYSIGSLRNHFVHCLSAEDRWLARLQKQDLPALLEYAHYPDQNTLRPHWQAHRQRISQYVNSLTEADLAEVIEVNFPHRGGAYQNSRWQILLHLVNHGTDHRAQILALLHDLGAPTFEQDLILHLWGKG